MNFNKLILESINQAKKSLADIVVSVQLTKRESVYSDDTGKVTDTTTVKNIDAAITDFKFSEIDGTNVRSDDVRAIIFDVDTVIDNGDNILVNSVDYKVIAVKPIVVGTSVVMLEVQLRK